MSEIQTRQVAVGIITKGDCVLLVFKDNDPARNVCPDKWQLPGGGLEGDETPEDAFIREIQEELGIQIKTDDFEKIGMSSEHIKDYKGKGPHIIIYHEFTVEWNDDVLEIDGSELSDARWVHKDRLPSYNLNAGARQLLIDAEIMPPPKSIQELTYD